MTTIRPILDRSITIEFFLTESKELSLMYNKREYSFAEFWSAVDDAEDICRYILEQFRIQYPQQYQRARVGIDDWKAIFIRVINNHLRILDKKLDVFIRSSGDVIFNLEC